MSATPWRRAAIAQTTAWLVVLGVGAAAGVHFAPWLLPVRVAEGPLVQRPDPNALVVVWYLTRPAACTFTLEADGPRRALPVESEGRRQRVVVANLPPGARAHYEIHIDKRMLAADDLRAPLAPQRDMPVHFIVFGDSGMGNREQYLLAAQMARLAPDFLLHTGDLVYPDGLRRRYAARFFLPYRKLLSAVPFWPCAGNHDVDKAGAATPYTSVFELPLNGPPGLPAEQSYWFDWGPLRCAVIDSNVDEATFRDRTLPWLRQVLGEVPPGVRWKFVVLHHPPYTVGKYAEPNAKTAAMHRLLPPVCDELGVDVVFAGHDHSYQRSRPLHGDAFATSGPAVMYVVTGAGGGELYTRKINDDRIALFYNAQHSFTDVALNGNRLDVRQVGMDGQTIDTWSLTRVRAAAPTSSAAAPATAPALAPG